MLHSCGSLPLKDERFALADVAAMCAARNAQARLAVCEAAVREAVKAVKAAQEERPCALLQRAAEVVSSK